MKTILQLILFLTFSFSTWAQTLIELTGTPYKTIDDVSTNLEEIEDYYKSHHDRRKLFAEIYGRITDGIEDLIRTGEVEHSEWLERLTVGFADEYRKAVLAYESGNIVSLPWRYDFTQAKASKIGLQTQLMLSLNSHILYDLPRALAMNADPILGLAPYKVDYFKMNGMFKTLMPVIFKDLYRETNYPEPSEVYVGEGIKRNLVFKLVKKMRLVAWKRALVINSLKKKSAQQDYLKWMALKTEKFSKFVTKLDHFISTKPGHLLPPHALNEFLAIWNQAQVELDEVYVAH